MGVPTWDILGVVSAELFWHMVETTVAILAVCLPAIRKVVSWTVFGKWLSLSSLGDLYHQMRSSRSSASRLAMHSGSKSDYHHSSSEERGTVSESSSRVALHSPDGGASGKRFDGVTTTRINGSDKHEDERTEMRDLGIYRIDTFSCEERGRGERQYV